MHAPRAGLAPRVRRRSVPTTAPGAASARHLIRVNAKPVASARHAIAPIALASTTAQGVANAWHPTAVCARRGGVGQRATTKSARTCATAQTRQTPLRAMAAACWVAYASVRLAGAAPVATRVCAPITAPATAIASTAHACAQWAGAVPTALKAWVAHATAAAMASAVARHARAIAPMATPG